MRGGGKHVTKAELKEWPSLCEEWDELDRRIKSLEGKTVGRAVQRVERSLQRLKAEKQRLNEAIERIEAAVYALPSIERRLIIMRYCERLSWCKIALDLGYSDAYVRGKLHAHALAFLMAK